MRTKTLIFFIDAVRPDYINRIDTPFLYDLKKKETFLKVRTLLGYSSGIHPSIWNSVYQEKHGYFLVYSYDPKHSDFKWIKNIGWLPSKIRQYLISILKAPYYMTKINKKLYPKWYKKSILGIPASIDPRMARFFKIEKQKYRPRFFQILKNNKISYSSQPDYDNEIYGKGVGINNWKLTNRAIDYYFVYEIDPLGQNLEN